MNQTFHDLPSRRDFSTRIFAAHGHKHNMPKKPPKPPDRERSPRYKKPEGKVGLKAALDALSSLSSAPPTHEHYNQYFKETRIEKSDRGAAILLATNLENALQSAIERVLGVDAESRRELFGSETSPIGTFSNKIRIASALRIFGSETRGNLDIIRRVRNAFAHAKIPISFSTTAVLDACVFLVLPELVPPIFTTTSKPSEEVDKAMQGRLRFTLVCENTSLNLIRFQMTGPMGIANEAVKVQLSDNYEVWARQQPLP